MKRHRNDTVGWLRRGSSLVVLAATLVAGCAAPQGAWKQWGGPNRNFSVDTTGLADHWPADGPQKLWQRELGDGYTTIVVDDGLLYTMYRKGDDEFVVSLNTKNGRVVWEYKTETPVTADMSSYGPGPYATPMIIGDRLYAAGTRSTLYCFDKKTGEVIWKNDLFKNHDALLQGFGLSSSPIAYGDTILLPVGRKIPGASEADATEGAEESKGQLQSLMAFDLKTGALVWDKKDFGVTKHTSTYSSPILIRFNGQDQLVLFMAKELAGLDPTSGEVLWSIPHKTQYDENISTPLWNGVDTLFCSAAYDSGARGVKLEAVGDKTVAKELWYTRKMRVLHGNVVGRGDYVYGSSGDFGPTFFMGINIKTGKVAWRERGFKKATCVQGDGKIIILDADGKLALATATPEKLTIHAQCNLDATSSWAAPTLVGQTLYVRDRKSIMALDLG